MIETNTTETRRRRGCLRAARHRAKLSRRAGRGRTVAFLVFLWAFLTGPFGAGAQSRQKPLPSSPMPESESWPVTDYERGLGGHTDYLIRPRLRTERYRSRPSLARLIADLRRPGARDQAREVLLDRIKDQITRDWTVDQIETGEINRLSIHIRSGRSEETVFNAWQSEAETRRDEAAGMDEEGDSACLLRLATVLRDLDDHSHLHARSGHRPAS